MQGCAGDDLPQYQVLAGLDSGGLLGNERRLPLLRADLSVLEECIGEELTGVCVVHREVDWTALHEVAPAVFPEGVDHDDAGVLRQEE